MKTQTVVEGGLVRIQGYRFTARNLRVFVNNDRKDRNCGIPYLRFDGFAEEGSDLKGTAYDGGVYGGNRLVYSWDPAIPVVPV